MKWYNLALKQIATQSAKLFRTTVLKVSSTDEIVREKKWNQQLNSHRPCQYSMV